jgi:hypothetical protein
MHMTARSTSSSTAAEASIFFYYGTQAKQLLQPHRAAAQALKEDHCSAPGHSHWIRFDAHLIPRAKGKKHSFRDWWISAICTILVESCTAVDIGAPNSVCVSAWRGFLSMHVGPWYGGTVPHKADPESMHAGLYSSIHHLLLCSCRVYDKIRKEYEKFTQPPLH